MYVVPDVILYYDWCRYLPGYNLIGWQLLYFDWPRCLQCCLLLLLMDYLDLFVQMNVRFPHRSRTLLRWNTFDNGVISCLIHLRILLCKFYIQLNWDTSTDTSSIGISFQNDQSLVPSPRELNDSLCKFMYSNSFSIAGITDLYLLICQPYKAPYVYIPAE